MTRVITQQFSTITQQFVSISARFDTQTDAIRAQFEETNLAVTALTATVGRQGQDIQEIKGRLDGIDDRLNGMDRRFDGMERRFDTQDEKLDRILERLPKQGECYIHLW